MLMMARGLRGASDGGGDCPVLVMTGGGEGCSADEGGGGGFAVLLMAEGGARSRPSCASKRTSMLKSETAPHACMHVCMAQPATVRDPAHRE